MNLTGQMIIRNELDRYLLDSLDVLLGFCDHVCVWDDASDDGTPQALADLEAGGRLKYHREPVSTFYEHEGRARQRALDWTLGFSPSHIIAVDADEIIEDGHLLRQRLHEDPLRPAWSLCMEEVWGCDEDELHIRTDGMWGPNRSTILYHVEGVNPAYLKIKDQALACGRVPEGVARRGGRSVMDVSILHLGWANSAERVARKARYDLHDGGRFHRGPHLDSILDEQQVTLTTCRWADSTPATLRRRLSDRVNRT